MSYLLVDANFPGGAVDHVQISETTITFEAPLDHSPQSLWFFFRIRGCQGQTLTLIQKGLEHVLGVRESRGYGPVVPVWRDGENAPWRRVDDASIVYTQTPLAFRFQITPEKDACYVAFSYPYLMCDWARFLQTLPADHITSRCIGVTKAGRPVVRYLLRAPGAQLKHLVVVTARQHAGEVSGSYVLEGLLRKLTDGSAGMQALLSRVCVCILPIMDQDCVEEGRYGKDQSPYDYNRDWRSQPFHPEIAALQAELESLSQSFQLLWAFDLHAPQPGAASYMPPARSNRPHSRLWNRMWNMGLAYEKNCRGRASFHLHDVDTEVLNWGGINNHALVEHYYAARWNCNMICFEYSYHRDGEGHILEIADWHALGEALADTLAEKLFDPHLDDAPDLCAIPTWAIPLDLNVWDSAKRVQGVAVEDSPRMLTLTATQDRNRCWFTSPLPDRPEHSVPAWELHASQPLTLQIYASYYQNGLLKQHSRIETMALEAGSPVVWCLPAAPEGCASVIGLIPQDDFSGTLTVKAQFPTEALS